MFLRLAYLLRIRNVSSGLLTRSLILKELSPSTWVAAADIAKQVPVTSGTVLYHLRNMERENIVEFNKKTRQWRLVELHQVPLSEFIDVRRSKKK